MVMGFSFFNYDEYKSKRRNETDKEYYERMDSMNDRIRKVKEEGTFYYD